MTMNTTDAPTEPHKPQPVVPAPQNGIRWWNWKIWLGLALAAIPVWACRPSAAKAGAEGTSAEAYSVAAIKVVREDLSRDQVFDAEFRPYEEIELHAKVPGFVETLTVDVGDRVTNGQLLATVEIPELNDDLDRSQALERRSVEEAKKTEAEHEEAHLAYGRLAAVEKAKPNLVAHADIDLAWAKDRAAEAALATAKQQIQVAGADVKKLETMLKYCRITAPFDGVITKRFTDPGALIQNGGSASTALVRLSQNNRLRLVFPVSVSFVSLIKIGDPVEIRIESLRKTLAGTVSRSTRKIETATRTMDVEVDVPNPELVLIPGMYASVSLKLERRDKALVVPVEAVSRQKTSTVYLINQESKIEERAIKLGLETPGKIEVLEGLTENDLVMVGSRSQVKPGQKVAAKMLETKNVE
jgi:RND family efflux transporter MFP subunit